MRVMKKNEDEREAVFYQPVWVLGLLCMILGEVGNLLAYGDPNTPTAVVTSVGCIGVVANLVIATVFLKEPFRFRDVMGSTFVVCGVILIVAFAPSNDEPLTTDQLNMYLSQWGAIVIYVVYLTGIIALFFAVKKLGHKSVVWFVLLSALIGAFTVMSSKPVSTFLMLSIEGLARDEFNDQLELSITTESACLASNGFGVGTEWRIVTGGDIFLVNGTNGYGCYFEGLGQLDQAAFWVALVILIVTAVTQVKYLNDALALFPNSEVIPVHYTLFTICSMIGSIVMYQEYHIREVNGCTQWWTLHMFLDGIGCTFMGVYFITTRRVVIDPDNPDSIKDGYKTLEADGSSVDLNDDPPLEGEPALQADSVRLVLGATPPAPPRLPQLTEEPAGTPNGADGTPAKPTTPWTASSSEGGPTPSPLPPQSATAFGGGGGGLSRQRTREIMMGETNGKRLSTSRLSAGSGDRTSFLDRAKDAALPKFPAGWDARPTERTSRASNVVNFLGALSGGQQAMFLHDPADKRTKDKQAAERAAARASFQAAADEPWLPRSLSVAVGGNRMSQPAKSAPAQPDQPSSDRMSRGQAPRGGRNRAQSSPLQYTGAVSAGSGSPLPTVGERATAEETEKTSSFGRMHRANSGAL